MNDLTAALLSAREEGEQLAGGTFVRETAERLDLSDLTFRQTRFARCQFTDCNFSGAAFYGCTFEDCAFPGCRFPVSFWKDAALSGCKAEGGDFHKARFKDCALDRLRLRWANLTGALWERCTLTDCDLKESGCQELRGARIHASQAAVVARILGIEIAD